MDSINKPITLGHLRKFPLIGRITEQPRGHAGPKGKHDKRQQVAHGHCSPPLLVEVRSEVGGERPPRLRRALCGLDLLLWSRGGEVEEDDQVQDGAGDVDERVRLVGQLHQLRVLEEPFLHVALDKDAEPLFDLDDLEGVLAGRVDGPYFQGDGCECAAELVYLCGWTMSVGTAWSCIRDEHTQ